MTSTVLRVKRRAEDSPQEALVLLCKRLKTDPTDSGGGSNLASNVFLFSGTVNDKDNINTYLKKWSKEDTKSQELHSAKNTTEILKKVRQERKDTSNVSRYEILNLSRGLKDISESDDVSYALVEVAKKSQEEEPDVQYAYDLYFSQKQDFDVSMLDDVVRIEDAEADLIFGTHRDNGRRTPSDKSSESSDDSNDENNWRNEYPDTEGSSVGDEDMRRAVADIDLGNDLSSDTGEDEIYNDPSFDPADLNAEDVKRYGLAYAKYKAKVLADGTSIEDKSNLVYCTHVKELDEESVDGYKDDEDDGFYYGMEEDTEHFVNQYRLEESEEERPD